MRRGWIMATLGLLTCLPAAAQRPSREEQRRTLDAARQIALHYSGTLPDFICTEMVQRANVLAGARSATKDRLTIQLSYFWATREIQGSCGRWAAPDFSCGGDVYRRCGTNSVTSTMTSGRRLLRRAAARASRGRASRARWVFRSTTA